MITILPCPAVLFLVETVFVRMHDLVCNNGNEHVRVSPALQTVG